MVLLLLYQQSESVKKSLANV